MWLLILPNSYLGPFATPVEAHDEARFIARHDASTQMTVVNVSNAGQYLKENPWWPTTENDSRRMQLRTQLSLLAKSQQTEQNSKDWSLPVAADSEFSNTKNMKLVVQVKLLPFRGQLGTNSKTQRLPQTLSFDLGEYAHTENAERSFRHLGDMIHSLTNLMH
jgi:hypothetical protein